VYICDSLAVSHKLCSSSQLGQFITTIPSDQINSTSILTETLSLTGNQTEMALYKVEKTGYYCVALVPAGNGTTFEAFVEWRFPYGELPAVDYPKLLVKRIEQEVYRKDLLTGCNSCMEHLLVFI
jgi:hypothetical protein